MKKQLRRHKDGTFRYNSSNFSGLKLLLVTMALSAYLDYRFAPQPAPISPLGAPIVVHAVEPAVQPIVEPSSTISELVDGIHFLESGRGKAKIGLQGICAGQGKSNEYGYGGMKLKICFDSKELARARVERWVTKHLEQFKDEGMTMCYYNLGLKVKDCKYYQDYLSMRSK